MSVISASDLHKAYGPQTLLDGVSIAIADEEKVGLVGRNGSGKSTLASILAGLETADSGSVSIRRGARIGYLLQAPVFADDRTAIEIASEGLGGWLAARAQYEEASAKLHHPSANLDALLDAQAHASAEIERLGGWDQIHQVEAMLEHLGIRSPHAKFGTMSGGERRRVALARLLVERPEVAILDEPTNHLDVETVDWLEGYLRDEFKGAILLITHDRYLLDRVVSRTVELDSGKVFSYDGGYEEYLSRKAERLAHVERTEQNRQNFLRKELEWLRRQPKARTGKQKARIDRAENARDTIKPKAEKLAELAAQEVRSGKTILELHHVRLEIGERVLAEDIDWILTQGERVGIIGANGSGKTTLLRAILGTATPASGKVVVGQNTQIGYFDQERAALDDELSIFENIARHSPKIEINGVPVEHRSYLEKFLFEPQKQRQPVGSLSGGERARVALAKLLSRSANLIILDEPTNDLDLATLGALEQMLVEFGGSCLVVTHDRWFLNRVATCILSFEGDGRVVRYPGNYDTYQRLRTEARRSSERSEGRKPAAPMRSPIPVAAEVPPQKLPTSVNKRGLTYGERLELEQLVSKVESADTRVAELEKTLADPGTYVARANEVPKLVADLEGARAAAAAHMKRWEELEAKGSS